MALETTPFDPVDFLDSPETMAFYLQDAIESGDAEEIDDAVEVVARAWARLTNRSPETSTNEGGAELPNLLAVLKSLGLKLAAHPIAA